MTEQHTLAGRATCGHVREEEVQPCRVRGCGAGHSVQARAGRGGAAMEEAQPWSLRVWGCGAGDGVRARAGRGGAATCGGSANLQQTAPTHLGVVRCSRRWSAKSTSPQPKQNTQDHRSWLKGTACGHVQEEEVQPWRVQGCRRRRAGTCGGSASQPHTARCQLVDRAVDGLGRTSCELHRPVRGQSDDHRNTHNKPSFHICEGSPLGMLQGCWRGWVCAVCNCQLLTPEVS